MKRAPETATAEVPAATHLVTRSDPALFDAAGRPYDVGAEIDCSRWKPRAVATFEQRFSLKRISVAAVEGQLARIVELLEQIAQDLRREKK
jgi:hypothetical protein